MYGEYQACMAFAGRHGAAKPREKWPKSSPSHQDNIRLLDREVEDEVGLGVRHKREVAEERRHHVRREADRPA